MPRRAPKEEAPLTVSTEVRHRYYASNGVCWVECTLMMPRIEGGGRGGARIAAFYAREEEALQTWCAQLADLERAAYEASTDPRKRFVHRCRRYLVTCQAEQNGTTLTVQRVVTLSKTAERPARAELYECWRLPEGVLLPPKKPRVKRGKSPAPPSNAPEK